MTNVDVDQLEKMLHRMEGRQLAIAYNTLDKDREAAIEAKGECVGYRSALWAIRYLQENGGELPDHMNGDQWEALGQLSRAFVEIDVTEEESDDDYPPKRGVQ